MGAAGPALVRRSPISRSVATWYAPLYSLLARVVHPIAFGAFVLSAFMLVGGVLLGVAGDRDSGAIGFVLLLGLLAVLPIAHSIVLDERTTPIAILLTAGWAIALQAGSLDRVELGALYVAAVLSLAFRVAAIVHVVPRRARTGLLNLVVPAAVGTLVGAVPVLLGGGAILANDMATARAVAIVMLWLAALAAIAFGVLHLVAASGESDVIGAWCLARGMREEHEGVRATDDLLGEFRYSAHKYRTVKPTHAIEVTAGAIETKYADLPVAWLTCVVLELRHRTSTDDIELWLRSRSHALDTIVPPILETSRIRTESIELEGGHEVHVARDVDPIVALQTLDPRVIDVARHLGRFQLCRSGHTIFAWSVGGVVDGEELDRMRTIVRETAVVLGMIESSSPLLA
jgi:hypothetical protein